LGAAFFDGWIAQRRTVRLSGSKRRSRAFANQPPLPIRQSSVQVQLERVGIHAEFRNNEATIAPLGRQ